MAIVICRTLIIYFALLITMRILGKRQLGELELSEFVLGALIADLASHPLQDMGIVPSKRAEWTCSPGARSSSGRCAGTALPWTS